MKDEGPRAFTAVVLAVVLGGGAIAYSVFQFHKVRQIERGTMVEGRAIDWRTTSRSPVHRVKYQFTHNGESYTGNWVRVSKDVHDRTRGGEPLPIRIATDRPYWHLPEGATADVKRDAAFLFFSGTVVLVFVLTALVLMRAAKRLKAKAAARAAQPTDNFPKDPPTGST